MPAASEARIAANRANSLKSCGPRTLAGKEQSRQNSFKHGMTGAGVVLSNEDAAEVERRSQAFRSELNPSGEVGEALVRRAAVCSVRMDRGVAQESAALSERVRQAEADFVAPEGVSPEEAANLRAEAGRRALFDPSREATLARKYEAAAERGFFRALKELRQLEKQAKADESAVEEEAYRRALGSFLPNGKGVAAAEPEPPAPAPMPAPRAVKQPRTILLEHIPGYSDVPFTIGRAH